MAPLVNAHSLVAGRHSHRGPFQRRSSAKVGSESGLRAGLPLEVGLFSGTPINFVLLLTMCKTGGKNARCRGSFSPESSGDSLTLRRQRLTLKIRHAYTTGSRDGSSNCASLNRGKKSCRVSANYPETSHRFHVVASLLGILLQVPPAYDFLTLVGGRLCVPQETTAEVWRRAAVLSRAFHAWRRQQAAAAGRARRRAGDEAAARWGSRLKRRCLAAWRGAVEAIRLPRDARAWSFVAEAAHVEDAEGALHGARVLAAQTSSVGFSDWTCPKQDRTFESAISRVAVRVKTSAALGPLRQTTASEGVAAVGIVAPPVELAAPAAATAHAHAAEASGDGAGAASPEWSEDDEAAAAAAARGTAAGVSVASAAQVIVALEPQASCNAAAAAARSRDTAAAARAAAVRAAGLAARDAAIAEALEEAARLERRRAELVAAHAARG
jgi:hypothetical protein